MDNGPFIVKDVVVVLVYFICNETNVVVRNDNEIEDWPSTKNDNPNTTGTAEETIYRMVIYDVTINVIYGLDCKRSLVEEVLDIDLMVLRTNINHVITEKEALH